MEKLEQLRVIGESQIIDHVVKVFACDFPLNCPQMEENDGVNRLG